MNAATARIRLLLVLGAVALNPVPSVGQERPDSVVRLEPLTVRVLQTSVGQGLPFPVSVASGDELTRARGGAYLEEALQALPGVQVQNRFNLAAGERLAIRGFGARAQFGIRGVRVLVDGIPATLADGQTALDHLDPSAIGRVEMLRGPGGALYGNAAGGALHFQTRPPSEGLEVGVESAGGSFGLTTLRASVSDGRGDTGYRASVSRYTFDGYRPDPVAGDGTVFGDQSRTVVNAVLQTPLARGTLTLSANAMDMAGDNPGSLSTALQETDRLQAYRFNVIQRTREDIRQGQVGVSWAGALGSLEGEAAAWGIRRDFEGAIPPAIVGFDRNAGGVRALVRGSRGTRAATLTVSGGVEAEFQSDDRQNWANERGERGSLDLDQDESVRGTAVFGQARLDLHARVGLLAAVRYDRFRFSADDRFLSDGADDSGERILDAVSPSFGVVVQAGDGVELFGSWASSFETPTTTELTNRPEGAGGFNPSLEPTRGRTLEAGVRARVHRRLALEGTLFRTDLEDELVAFEVPSTPGRTFFRNAGESRHTGWEMALDGRPAPAWALRAAYTRVNGRYEAYTVDGEDFSGNRIPGLAPYRIDGRIAWEPRGGFVELRGLYQDALPVDDANTAASPGYFLADVRAGLEGYRAGRVALAPWVAVANALDRSYNTAVVVNAFGGRFYEPGPGRTFRLGMAVTWGSR